MEEHKESEFNPIAEHDVRCADTVMNRSHNRIMAAIGYEMPVSTKRPKSLWVQCRDEFPCDPVLQHRVWAFRIKCLFQRDCGFNPDWNCKCEKCESHLAEELLLYDNSMGIIREVGIHEEATDMPEIAEELVASVDLCNICEGIDDSGLQSNAAFYTGPTTIPNDIGWVHLLLTLEEVGNPHGPTTLFITVLNMNDPPSSNHVPRKMWIRSRSITPTYLSFRR